jgi:valyl-tRNA synthetase
MLKLQDNLVTEELDKKSYVVFSNRIKARIFFEKVESETDRIAKEAQIKLLKSSIERREKLLSNENYVNKAPANIVELDKQKQIDDLKNSIARREKLLSNENYVNKAPANIVQMDREKLEEEKAKLAELLK